MFSATGILLLYQNVSFMSCVPVEQICKHLSACFPESCRSRAPDIIGNHRHSCSRRSAPWRIGEDMQKAQVTFLNQFKCSLKHSFSLCGKASNEIRPKGDFRPEGTGTGAAIDHSCTVMTSFHTFQYKVVSRLNAQMKVRHQPWFVSDGRPEFFINRGWVQRGKT